MTTASTTSSATPQDQSATELTHEAALRRDWIKFTALTFLFSFGFAVYGGVFQNFLKDIHHAEPIHVGGLESLREIPGLLTALLAGTLAAMAESRIAGLGLLITGVGIGSTAFMPSFAMLIASTVFWSVGAHLYFSTSSAITLALSKGKEGGRHLGRMNGVGSAAVLIALGVAWLVRKWFPELPYNAYFLVAGVTIFLSGVLCMLLSTHAASDEPRERFIVRREYNLYYLLIFLEGCRRQIFSIFASFTLVKVYHADLSVMLALQFVNAALIAVTAPAMGRIIDRRGEREPLLLYAVGLIFVFLGYAVWRNLYALYFLYLVDNILFSFTVGFTMYLNRIVRRNEMTPCLAMGLTMNHIAAVSVPILGALLWQQSANYQLPFWIGVIVACISLYAATKLPSGRAENLVAKSES